jgi:hypothetical protein
MSNPEIKTSESLISHSFKRIVHSKVKGQIAELLIASYHENEVIPKLESEGWMPIYECGRVRGSFYLDMKNTLSSED